MTDQMLTDCQNCRSLLANVEKCGALFGTQHSDPAADTDAIAIQPTLLSWLIFGRSLLDVDRPDRSLPAMAEDLP